MDRGFFGRDWFESYIKRARNAGVILSDDLIIDCWLRSLGTISEPRLLFHIDAWRRQREFERQQGDDSSLLLQDLQARLIHDQDLYLSHASRNISNTQTRPLTSNWRQVPPRGPYPQSRNQSSANATHTSSDPARRLIHQRHGNTRPKPVILYPKSSYYCLRPPPIRHPAPRYHRTEQNAPLSASWS